MEMGLYRSINDLKARFVQTLLLAVGIDANDLRQCYPG